MFFSEEKNQKTFALGAIPDLSVLAPTVRAAEQIKVFWFFSSEKNYLLCFGFRLPYIGPGFAAVLTLVAGF